MVPNRLHVQDLFVYFGVEMDCAICSHTRESYPRC